LNTERAVAADEAKQTSRRLLAGPAPEEGLEPPTR
jgi:hypothetical protein